MDIAGLLAIAMAPAIVIMVWIYIKDKYEREPVGLLIMSFLLGVLSIIPAILLELLASLAGIGEGKELMQVVVHAFLVVAVAEEGSKYLFLRTFSYRRKAFNEPFDGIVYAVMIGMGFALTENIMYVVQHGATVGLVRAFTAVPLHACCAVIMGFWVGAAKFTLRHHRLRYHVYGLMAAIFIHGLYDFLLMQKSYPYLVVFAVPVLYLSVRMSLRAIRINQRLSPFRKWKFSHPIEERNAFPEAP